MEGECQAESASSYWLLASARVERTLLSAAFYFDFDLRHHSPCGDSRLGCPGRGEARPRGADALAPLLLTLF